MMAVLSLPNDDFKAQNLQHLELLDMSRFLHGDVPARFEFSRSLVASLQSFGVAKLKATDLPGCDTAGLFRMVSPLRRLHFSLM